MAMNVLPKLKERLQSARSVAVLTGAGISADSGVPTFRGQDGLRKILRRPTPFRAIRVSSGNGMTGGAGLSPRKIPTPPITPWSN